METIEAGNTPETHVDARSNRLADCPLPPGERHFLLQLSGGGGTVSAQTTTENGKSLTNFPSFHCCSTKTKYLHVLKAEVI